MKSIFNFFGWSFNNNSSSTSKKHTQRNHRISRIETLEDRDMLSASPWDTFDNEKTASPVDYNAAEYDLVAAPTKSAAPEMHAAAPEMHAAAPEMHAAAPANANVYELNLVESQGLTDYAYWNDAGRLEAIRASYYDTDETLTGSINLSNCTFLTHVSIWGNELTSLNVSGCTNLEFLDCSENQLTSLNVTGCTNLEVLACYLNNLTTLNVSNFTALEDLDCYGNKLTSLNVSGCVSLQYLDCSGMYATHLEEGSLGTHNQLTTLDVSDCTLLEELRCYDNKLTSLNLTGLTQLAHLDCSLNQITSINLTDQADMLMHLFVGANKLKSLDVSKCLYLQDLGCNHNELTNLNLNGLMMLASLTAYENDLTSLDLRNTGFAFVDPESIMVTQDSTIDSYGDTIQFDRYTSSEFGNMGWVEVNRNLNVTEPTTMLKVGTPSNFRAVQQGNNLVFSWNEAQYAAGYSLEVAYTDETGTFWQGIGNAYAGQTSFTLPYAPGGEHQYRITAYGGPAGMFIGGSADITATGTQPITQAEFNEIIAKYPEGGFTADMYGYYNFIEIQANELTEANLRAAIAAAESSGMPTGIIVRTTATQHTIKLSGTDAMNPDLTISSDVAIVAMGEKNLTIDGDQKTRAFRIVDDASVLLAGVNIINGKVGYAEGGGIDAFDAAQLVMIDCTVTNCSAYGGGGIAAYVAELYNCTITNNTAGSGAGIAAEWLYMVNSSVTDNTVRGVETGEFNEYGAVLVYTYADIANCTIAGNTSGIYHYTSYDSRCAVYLVNSVVAMNDIHDIMYQEDGAYEEAIFGQNNVTSFSAWSPDNEESHYQGNWVSQNNGYNADEPLFVDAANGNYQLAVNSQAIDKGDIFLWESFYGTLALRSIDLAGNPRISNNAIDIGAYEYYVDTTAPTSKIWALPPKAGSDFTVSWSGNDVGRGIAYYEIFVSTDGINYELWHKTETAAETSAVYENGEVGSTYTFYSIAYDFASNFEAAPATADATVTVTGKIEEVVAVSEYNPETEIIGITWAHLEGYTYEIYRAGDVVRTQTPDQIFVDSTLPDSGLEAYVIIAYGDPYLGQKNYVVTTVVYTTATPLELTAVETSDGTAVKLTWEVAPDTIYWIMRSGDMVGALTNGGEIIDASPEAMNDYMLYAIAEDGSYTFSNLCSMNISARRSSSPAATLDDFWTKYGQVQDDLLMLAE